MNRWINFKPIKFNVSGWAKEILDLITSEKATQIYESNTKFFHQLSKDEFEQWVKTCIEEEIIQIHDKTHKENIDIICEKIKYLREKDLLDQYTCLVNMLRKETERVASK